MPLGLVALNWVRAYLPLVAAGLPQMPGNAGPDGLGFAKAGFRALTTLGWRPGPAGRARFTGERAAAVAGALAEAARTIAAMPANFTRYPNSDGKDLRRRPGRAPRVGGELVLDAEVLRAYGTLAVPGHVWRAMQRLGAWVEPVLVAEWARLVRGYGERTGRAVAPGEAEAALAWLDPVRDTRDARNAAERLIAAGVALRCVWSGTAQPRGVGHRPLPALVGVAVRGPVEPAAGGRRVNQHLKRDRLPSAAALAAAREAVVGWWEAAWRSDPALEGRFGREAAAALPVSAGASSEDVFAALEWRRLRLRQDQQVEEWAGVAARQDRRPEGPSAL